MEDKKKNETRQSTMQNRMENMNGQKPKTISIVISVYNEEKALHGIRTWLVYRKD